MACNCSSNACAPVSYTPQPLRQGTTLLISITLMQGTPAVGVDLSTSTVSGKIGVQGEVLKLLGTGGNGITISSNTISIRVEADETQNWRAGKHPYRIDVEFADNTVVELLYGFIIIKKSN